MKKILLCAINAKYIHSNPAVHILKSYAGELSQYIEIAEYTINQNMENILADIYKRKPDVIAFSCYIWNWGMVRRLLREIPKIMDAKLWLGGPEVSYDAEKELRSYENVCGVMVGEGEETFKELVSHYCTGSPELEDIAGLCIRGKEIHFTPIRQSIALDDIPFYYDNLEDFENRIIYYESSRGCPYRCSYCLSSIDKKVRLRSLEKVYSELAFFLKNRVRQVKFIDRTFNCNHEHALGIWRYILENDNGVTNFHFEISADIITEEELEVLLRMRPGLVQLEIGVQTTNSATIRAINRRMDIQKLKYVVDRIGKCRNIHRHLDLIAGLPYEDYDSFKRSFNDVYSMRPEQLQLGFLKVLKGSPMEEMSEGFGIRYQSEPPYEVLSTDYLSYGDILRLKQVEEMVEIYYNSGQFDNTVRLLEPYFQTPFDMYLSLADYYEKNGLYTNKPARSYRYEVLLGFALPFAEADMIKEALTLDMYLREKCKSRPSFAKNLSEYKSEIYKRERDKKDHIDVFQYRVWEDGKRLDEPEFILFDYEDRNPFNNNAGLKMV